MSECVYRVDVSGDHVWIDRYRVVVLGGMRFGESPSGAIVPIEHPGFARDFRHTVAAAQELAMERVAERTQRMHQRVNEAVERLHRKEVA